MSINLSCTGRISEMPVPATGRGRGRAKGVKAGVKAGVKEVVGRVKRPRVVKAIPVEAMPVEAIVLKPSKKGGSQKSQSLPAPGDEDEDSLGAKTIVKTPLQKTPTKPKTPVPMSSSSVVEIPKKNTSPKSLAPVEPVTSVVKAPTKKTPPKTQVRAAPTMLRRLQVLDDESL